MNRAGEALKEVLTNSIAKQQSATSACDTRNCPVCEKEIRALAIVNPLTNNPTGRYIMPKCECEIERDIYAPQRKAKELVDEKETMRMFDIDNAGKRFETLTFAHYIPRPGSEKMLSYCKWYAEKFSPDNPTGLLLWGEPGNGKTHVAAAIARDIKAQGHTVVFQSVPELLEQIRGSYNRESKTSSLSIMNALMKCSLLILDDLGAERMNEWVEDTMFRVIDGRYRRKLPILITTNLNPTPQEKGLDLLGQIGKRMHDRITEMTIAFENRSTSYRQEIAERRLESLRKRDGEHEMF